MFTKIKNFILEKNVRITSLLITGATAVGTTGIIVTNSGVTIEDTDLTTITNANGAYLSSAFQIVELLPYIAVLSGGFYVLNKVFGIIPKVGGGN